MSQPLLQLVDVVVRYRARERGRDVAFDALRGVTLEVRPGEAVGIIAGRVPCEASGGVRLDTIGAIAATGVTYVSVGRLTQSAPAADVGLDFTPL